MMKERSRRRALAGLVALVCAAAAVAAAASGAARAPQDRPDRPARLARQDLIVQSTTSVRDSGVLDRLITPQFEKRFPQWNLKFIAVGTGQAIANARAGQGDVLIGHSPALEAQFVRDGFSYERVGRTVMWNDFVVVGPVSDPAGILRRARHDAVGAFEAIAAAGAAGRANFVSRGDDSGTNAKERDIWGRSRVANDAQHDPSGSPRWYHRAGLGMADTLRLTQQCPFAGGGCYTITDRGTLQQLTSNRAISLGTVMDGQDARARGGRSLMLNVYNVYAVNPRKFRSVRLRGALAFMDFLTSKPFQDALATFPTRRRPGFFPAALPRVRLGRPPRRSVAARAVVTVTGTIASAVPGAAPLAGLPVRLTEAGAGRRPVVIGRARVDARGRFRVRARPASSGSLALVTPRFRNLSALTRALGPVTVR